MPWCHQVEVKLLPRLRLPARRSQRFIVDPAAMWLLPVSASASTVVSAWRQVLKLQPQHKIKARRAGQKQTSRLLWTKLLARS
mmetsp:Transcript_89879/g.142998  ORF Transcript_89879/g.142998 Transcript_89879/m.142998 type:complete len:83 (-) Transcript_89879:1701-1949(-)